MGYRLFRTLGLDEIRRVPRFMMLGAIAFGSFNGGSMAQTNQPPSRPLTTIVLPEANRPPDANDQMIMREKNTQKHNFDTANLERLKQLLETTQALETMAMALEAEVEKSGEVSENTLHKAETIEKLARIAKQRMTLTIAPN